MNYACDFETTTETKSRESTQVYLWCAITCDKNEKEFYGEDIKSFINFIKVRPKNNFYFHNLKFDGIFILDYLLFHLDFKYDISKKANTFNALISDMGMFYSITIYFQDNEKVTIYDSCKKFAAGTSIRSMATAFETGLEKLSYNYETDKANAIGYMYIRNDTLILARALKQLFKLGSKKMTVGSDAYSFWAENYGENFERDFPQLSDEIEDDLRNYYKGGYTYVNRFYKNKILNNIDGVCYDKNSMHPSSMIANVFPYGQPYRFKGKYKYNEKYPLYCQHIRCYFAIKKDMPPTVQKGFGKFSRDYILTNLADVEPMDLYLTDVDLKLFFQCYDTFDLEYIDGYMFKCKKGMFDSYIKKWYTIKATSKGAKKSFAKLMLNSFYGKFGEKSEVCGKIVVKKNGIVGFVKGEPQRKKNKKYLPVAIWTTAYSRYDLIDKIIKAGGDSPTSSFLYCDTDSLHCLDRRVLPFIDIDQNAICCWKEEYTFSTAKYLRAKCYYEQTDDKTIVRIAGLPITQAETIKLNEFDYGTKRKKLMPKIVKGGVLLLESEYIIRDKKGG